MKFNTERGTSNKLKIQIRLEIFYLIILRTYPRRTIRISDK